MSEMLLKNINNNYKKGARIKNEREKFFDLTKFNYKINTIIPNFLMSLIKEFLQAKDGDYS